MKFRNPFIALLNINHPCKYCLKKPTCTLPCDDRRNYNSNRNKLYTLSILVLFFLGVFGLQKLFLIIDADTFTIIVSFTSWIIFTISYMAFGMREIEIERNKINDQVTTYWTKEICRKHPKPM